MFGSSNRNDGFEYFAGRGGNPSSQNLGPVMLNPFQANNPAPALKTTFGHDLRSRSQPPLPPGGIMGNPGSKFGSHVPFSAGNLVGQPSSLSGEFGGVSTNDVFFERVCNSVDKVHTDTLRSFNSTTSRNNSLQHFSSSASTPTVFGFASNGNKQPANQRFGRNEAKFGKSTNFSNQNLNTGQTVFGTSKHRRDTLFHDSSGKLGNLNAQAPMGAHVQQKPIASHSLSSMHADNPFASPACVDGTTNKLDFRTTFGGGSGTTSSISFPSFGNPSNFNGAVNTTAFGHKRRNSKVQSGAAPVVKSEKNLALLDGQMAGLGKLPRHKGRLAEDSGEVSIAHPSDKHSHVNDSVKPLGGGDGLMGTRAPMPSATKEKLRKQRHNRLKKKAPSTSDDSFIPMPSDFSTLKNEGSCKAELAAATNLDGQCAEMCSQAERELHIRVDELSVFEKSFPDRPGTERDMIIKRFQRSSADHKLDISEEIRPPGVLRRTQLYIEQAIMDLDQCGIDPRFQTPRVPEPIELYNFCWDRFRMIRKDFVLQNYRGAGGRVHPIVLDVHERIARYHILSEHELIETPSFVAQQNMEQLGQTLKSLNELYDESHKISNPAYCSPFEAEFRAYFILCTLDNGRGMDVLKYVKNLPVHIMESVHLNFAMRVFVARHTGDYYQFFSLLRQATYLQSCLLFRYISNVRSSALLRMNRAYRSQSYPLEDLVEQLCFDDIDHAYSVCREHRLQLSGSPGSGDDTVITVKFGGEFETGMKIIFFVHCATQSNTFIVKYSCLVDAQLRRNNTPLKTRSSKIYVGMKQGNNLRRDICRGVTEYARNEYPALSKLIQDLEREEQAKLYPEKPPYADDYSFFVNCNQGASKPASVSSRANMPSSQQILKKVELDAIAERKKELERKKLAMLERMHELERVKEKKTQRQQAINVAGDQTALRQVHSNVEATALSQDEEDSKQFQKAYEAQLRDQEKQQKEKDLRKKAEEAAQEARRKQEIALQRAEALRQKAIEEERREKEKKMQEEAFQNAVKERERRRQQEAAEARAREARVAAFEAQRQTQLAKERDEKKRLRREEKQRLAVMKLRLYMWKNYVQASRDGPGPISIASRLQLLQPHQRAKDSMQWLFLNSPIPLIGTKRLKPIPKAEEPVSFSTAELLSLWQTEDILKLVGPCIRRQNIGASYVAWKLVIADLLENASSSFGLWCAVRAGAQDVSTPERDCYRLYCSSSDVSQGVAVCSRYLDSTFTHRNTRERQQYKLAATSAILLPVDLSTLQQAGNVASYEKQIVDLLSLLDTGCRVTVFGVGFASVEIKSSAAQLLRVFKSCIESAQLRFQAQVGYVSVELVDSGCFLSLKFSQVLKRVAELSPPFPHIDSVGMKEILEDTTDAVLNRLESSINTQSRICAFFPRVHQDLLSSGIMDFVYIPPEMKCAFMDPQHGWNFQERRDKIQTVLTALEETRIVAETSPVDRDQTCDVYFKKVEEFIDQLFLSNVAATSVSTYELKKRIYSVILPIHEQLVESGMTEKVTPREADELLPWRAIFKEIYMTYFETISDITIYYPTSRRIGSSLVDFARLLTSKQWLDPSPSIKRDYPVVKQSVPVTRQSIQKSFGTIRAVSEYKMVGTIKRLRVELEKERAASSQYQRMLRQALNRWDN
ncbi:hypothetical protein Plhal304r1_c076g0163651 [Plasmopara halstedii]